MISSPLNYTGNKFKLLKQLIPYLEKTENLVDVFAGSGLVALNSYSKNIVLNDNNKITIDLLNYFKNNNSDFIFLSKFLAIIFSCLSCCNISLEMLSDKSGLSTNPLTKP